MLDRSSQAAHLRHLNELVEAQAQYYEQCHKVMTDLQKEMARWVASGIILILSNCRLDFTWFVLFV